MSPSQQSPQSPQEPKEEKLEFLKREEVRTMAGDIAKAREEEAEKQRERIANLKEQKEAKKEPSRQQGQKEEQKKQEEAEKIRETLMPKKPPTPTEKVFVRLIVGGVILFVLFNAGAFGYWYFFRNGEEPQTQAPSPGPVAPPPAPEPVPPPAPVGSSDPTAPSDDGAEPTPLPAPFFEAETTRALELESPDALLPSLAAFLNEAPPGFAHITHELYLDVFLEQAGITVPQEVRDKLSDSFMLVSWSNQGRNRLGLLFELQATENLQEAMSEWEASMEQDTQAFFDIIGGKGSSYTSVFRSSAYQGVPVRFQTYSVLDFGIVYGIMDPYLILTSSFESFQRIIDNLQQ